MVEFGAGGAASGAISGAQLGTAIMPGWGTLIGAAAGGLLGGFTGGGNGYSGKGKWPGNSQELYDLQVDSLKKAVQWRVADAKAAGIHPLFALGGQFNTGGMAVPVSPPPSGSNIGDLLNGAANVAASVQGALSEREATRLANQERAALQQAQDRQEQRLLRDEVRQDRLVNAQVMEAEASAALNRARAADAMTVAQTRSRQAMVAPILNSRQDATATRNAGIVPLPDNPQPPLGVGFGKGLASGTGISNAEDFEARYGDIVNEAFGLYKLGRDVIRSLPWGDFNTAVREFSGRHTNGPDPERYDPLGNPY